MNDSIFVGTHLPPDEYEAFKASAKREGRSLRSHLRMLTLAFIRQEQTPTPPRRTAKVKGGVK